MEPLLKEKKSLNKHLRNKSCLILSCWHFSDTTIDTLPHCMWLNWLFWQAKRNFSQLCGDCKFLVFSTVLSTASTHWKSSHGGTASQEFVVCYSDRMNQPQYLNFSFKKKKSPNETNITRDLCAAHTHRKIQTLPISLPLTCLPTVRLLKLVTLIKGDGLVWQPLQGLGIFSLDGFSVCI